MGASPHPPRAPYNSAFVGCFTVFLFPSSPANLRQGQLCLGREEKKTKRRLTGPWLIHLILSGVGVSFREKMCSVLLPTLR